MNPNARKKLCIALDVDRLSDALSLAKELKDSVGLFKIGSQLFTEEGPRSVEAIRNIGGLVFLDLKFHDIPNTVANAARMAVKIGANVFNIHASGGSEMMRAAVEAANDEAYKLGVSTPTILAVTLLTSIDENILKRELFVDRNTITYVTHLASLAKASNVPGVVASPKEITAIRKECGPGFIILTPGIRPIWSATSDDQKRITTPSDAVKMGADFIVVGRPIIKADNPVKAAESIVSEMEEANA